MLSETRQKTANKPKSTISVYLKGIPVKTVHKKMQTYRRKISVERNEDFTLDEAYREWMIESTQHLPE